MNVDSTDLNSVRTLNILENVLGMKTKFHFCGNGGRPNPDLRELESKTYREQYEEMFSDSGKPLHCYGESDYDGYISILTEEEWLALPETPATLKELRDERARCLELEAEAGIIHNPTDSIQYVPIPKLIINTDTDKEVTDCLNKIS